MSLLEEILDGGSQDLVVRASVSDAEEAMVQLTFNAFRRVDVLVNNASNIMRSLFITTSKEI